MMNSVQQGVLNIGHDQVIPRGGQVVVLNRKVLVSLGIALMLCAVGCLSPGASAASLDLSRLQVFVSESINADRSDYEGSAAAGGKINLSDFDIGGDLLAGNSIIFKRGKVHGDIRTSNHHLDHVFAGSSEAVGQGDWKHLLTQLDELDRRVSSAASTMQPIITREEFIDNPLTVVHLTASHNLDIVDLPAELFKYSDSSKINLVMSGDANSKIVVRIQGGSLSLENVGFAILGDLTPGQILFAFPEAQDVSIIASGGAVGARGADWGIPGSILAPHAQLRLAAVRITGHVFARGISSVDGLPSGQINRINNFVNQCGMIFPQSVVLSNFMSDSQKYCDTSEVILRRLY